MSKSFKVAISIIIIAILIYCIQFLLEPPFIQFTWGDEAPAMRVASCTYHGVWIELLHVKLGFWKYCMSI